LPSLVRVCVRAWVCGLQSAMRVYFATANATTCAFPKSLTSLTSYCRLLLAPPLCCADWIDGLETFIQQIQHKGWLGGWLLPQVRRLYLEQWGRVCVHRFVCYGYVSPALSCDHSHSGAPMHGNVQKCTPNFPALLQKQL
jgi:hypothetical protein